MGFKEILLIIAFILDIGLAIFVYLNNRRRELNITYSLLALWTSLWTLGIAIFRTSDNYQTQLFWNQIFIVAAVLIASSFLHFSFIFSESGKEIKLRNWQRFLIYIPTLIILWGVISPGVLIKSIEIRSWGNESILGWGYIYYGLYFGAIWLWGTVNLIRKYFKAIGIFRAQLRYILVGLTISVIFGATFNLIFILLGNYRFIWLGPYASFIFLVTTTYAIARYRLMDIRLVFRRIFIYFGVTAFTYGAFYLVAWVYQNELGSVFSATGYLAGLLIAPIFVVSLYGIEKLFKIIANKYFFVSIYNYQETINKLTQKLNYLIDLDKIIDSIVNTIKQTMQLDRVGVLLINQDENPVHYQITKTEGFNIQNGISLVKDNFLTRYLQKTKSPLVRDELTYLIEHSKTENNRKGFSKLYKNMAHIEVSICLPLMSSGKLIGIIVLGSKISGDAFTKEDLELLTTLSYQAGIAIENARLYKNVEDFSKTLQAKVNEQTKDIKEKNIRLEKLLKVRSEFLDIASHQLRTPVSLIRGVLSMIREGDMEKLPKEKQRQFIENAWEKGSKLDIIINDILSASELDSQKFMIDSQTSKINLEDVVDKVVNSFKLEAKQRGINLKWQKPKKPLPQVIGNAKYLEQAVSNFLSNALKYTPSIKMVKEARSQRKVKGVVGVEVNKVKNDIVVKVSDNGIGIPKEEVKKLFAKFSRASNATEMYTDGSGLGLFIVKEIIDGHKGKVWLESEIGKGSKFYFSLPIAKAK